MLVINNIDKFVYFYIYLVNLIMARVSCDFITCHPMQRRNAIVCKTVTLLYLLPIGTLFKNGTI